MPEDNRLNQDMVTDEVADALRVDDFPAEAVAQLEINFSLKFEKQDVTTSSEVLKEIDVSPRSKSKKHREILESISSLDFSHQSPELQKVKSDLEVLKARILGEQEMKYRIECLQNPNSIEELTATLKWMVHKGTDNQIDLLLEVRRNPSMSNQETFKLIDYAIKEILERREQIHRMKGFEAMIVPSLDEPEETRRRRYQKIQDYATKVLESAINAEHWLHSSRTELDDLTPYDLLATEEGTAIIGDMLGRIDSGVYF
jgi:putative toxin-antitoxin system antitoxin component (TIGR02293 family)